MPDETRKRIMEGDYPTLDDWQRLLSVVESSRADADKARTRSKRSRTLAIIAIVLAGCVIGGAIFFAANFRDIPASQDAVEASQRAVQENQKVVLCASRALGLFASSVGNFSASPPAPNPQRDMVQQQLDAVGNVLEGLGRTGHCDLGPALKLFPQAS